MPTQRVLDCIQRVTALNTVSPVSETQRVALTEINIPFLASQFKDQVGIRVRLAPVKIMWGQGRARQEDRSLRHFTIYLDSEANKVLAVTCRLTERSPDVREASVEEAEKQLRNHGEVYVSFPEENPKFSFMDALEEVRTNGRGDPEMAQEIDAVYVMHSVAKKEPRPVWVITLRGLPPYTVRNSMREDGRVSKQPPVWRRNMWRKVVDANTGKWIFGSNSPRPE
jgi:hypothetical protein